MALEYHVAEDVVRKSDLRRQRRLRALGSVSGLLTPFALVALWFGWDEYVAALPKYAGDAFLTLPTPVTALILLLAAAVVAGLVASTVKRLRRPPRSRPVGVRPWWVHFFAGYSVAVAIWLLLIGGLVLTIALLCGWRP